MGPVVTSTIEYVWRYSMVHRQVHTLFIKQIRKELGGRVTADNVHIRVGPQWTHSSPVGL